MDYVERCHRDRNMDWTASEENAVKDGLKWFKSNDI
jgi:hypothetical protein